jgi:hypothetical protein
LSNTSKDLKGVTEKLRTMGTKTDLNDCKIKVNADLQGLSTAEKVAPFITAVLQL